MRTDMGIDCLESVIGVNYSCSLNNVENKFNKLRGLQDEGRCVFYTTNIKKKTNSMNTTVYPFLVWIIIISFTDLMALHKHTCRNSLDSLGFYKVFNIINWISNDRIRTGEIQIWN